MPQCKRCLHAANVYAHFDAARTLALNDPSIERPSGRPGMPARARLSDKDKAYFFAASIAAVLAASIAAALAATAGVGGAATVAALDAVFCATVAAAGAN